MERTKRQGFYLPRSFAFDEYLQMHSSQNLRKLVSVEPTTIALMWAPVAALSWAAELLDLSWSGQLQNSFVLAEAGVLPLPPPLRQALTEQAYQAEISSIEIVFVAAQFGVGAWACANFYQMSAVKWMLRPQLASRSTADGGPAVRRLLPPKYCLAGGRRGMGWGPLEGLAALLEAPFAKTARNAHENLFGVVGANGPQYYLESQKLVLFNAISSIAIAISFLESGSAAAPLLWAGLVPASAAIALSPPTFLAYNWATAVEEYTDERALRGVLTTQRERAFLTTLRTLSRLCDCFEQCADGGCFVEGRGGERRLPVKRLLDSRDPSRVRALLAVFDFSDLNSCGTICRSELETLAHVLGYELDDTVVSNFFEQVCGSPRDMAFGDFASAVLSGPTADQPQLARHASRLFGFFDGRDTGAITITHMNLRLERLGLDTAGTEQLFVDITGLPKRTVTRREFTKYLERADRV